MITHLDPKSFDQRIQEIYDKRQAEEVARQARNETPSTPSPSESPMPEPEPPVKVSHANLLRRAIRNLSRHDSKVVWTLLHRDVYQALVDLLDCNDLGMISEACYLIYDKLPHVDWRALEASQSKSSYFYEIPHGEYLGADSWHGLVQSQLLHNPGGDWIGVPIVQANRYKVIRSYHIHTRVTAYILHCTDLIIT